MSAHGRARWALPLGVAVCGLVACSSPIGSASTSASPTGGVAAASGGAGEQGYTAVVDAVSPSIVLIETSSGLGSGVVYDSSGDIVTNAHVAGDSTSFKVTASNGKQYDATLVGTFAASDVAVIKVNTGDLKPAQWGDSSKLEVGQVVLAMGNPLGFQSSVTDGIVSGLGRTIPEEGGAVLTDMIQTSAAINPGNSGGGLVDLQGKVIGMPTLAAADPQMGGAAPGIGFALSSNTVLEYAKQIVQNGKVVNTHRAYLGVQVGAISDNSGVVVLALVPSGPAANAGIKEGDVITGINNHPVTDPTSLSAQLATLSPGSSATVAITRDGQHMSITVKLGTLPAA